MQLPVSNPRPWYADGLSFTCTQCGNCCTGEPGYVWISQVELQRLSDFLKRDIEDVVRRYCRKLGGGFSLKEKRAVNGEHDCIFLERIQGRRICTVYEVRPLQCRTWPFWEGNLSSERAWRRAGENCPGMNRGKRYTLEQIEALRDATDWPNLAPGSDQPPPNRS